jgi:hypothetical protein
VYVSAETDAGLSRNIIEQVLGAALSVFTVTLLASAPEPTIVPFLAIEKYWSIVALAPKLRLEKIRILLVVDCGVIVKVRPVMFTKEVEEVLKVLAVTFTLSSCKTRKAPRRSFCCAAVKTCPATNEVGRLVGVAINVSC